MSACDAGQVVTIAAANEKPALRAGFDRCGFFAGLGVCQDAVPDKGGCTNLEEIGQFIGLSSFPFTAPGGAPLPLMAAIIHVSDSRLPRLCWRGW